MDPPRRLVYLAVRLAIFQSARKLLKFSLTVPYSVVELECVSKRFSSPSFGPGQAKLR